LSTPFERRVETGEDPATLEQRAGELAPGAPMRWSHYDGETSLALLSGSGLEIERGDADHQRQRVLAVGPLPKRRITTCRRP
jgi:hypothetical protein